MMIELLQSHETAVLRKPQETMNDYNDRMIRASVAYFNDAVADEDTGMQALMISNDKANTVSSCISAILIVCVRLTIVLNVRILGVKRAFHASVCSHT